MVSPTGFFRVPIILIYRCVYLWDALGLNSLITEESEGTIEYLYAQPISRREIVGWKFLARLLLLTGFWLIAYGSSLASFALFKLPEDDLSAFIEEISKIFVAEYGVLVFFLCLGFFLSTILRSSKQTASVGLGCVFGLYLLGIVGNSTINWNGWQDFHLCGWHYPSNSWITARHQSFGTADRYHLFLWHLFPL